MIINLKVEPKNKYVKKHVKSVILNHQRILKKMKKIVRIL